MSFANDSFKDSNLLSERTERDHFLKWFVRFSVQLSCRHSSAGRAAGESLQAGREGRITQWTTLSWIIFLWEIHFHGDRCCNRFTFYINKLKMLGWHEERARLTSCRQERRREIGVLCSSVPRRKLTFFLNSAKLNNSRTVGHSMKQVVYKTRSLRKCVTVWSSHCDNLRGNSACSGWILHWMYDVQWVIRSLNIYPTFSERITHWTSYCRRHWDSKSSHININTHLHLLNKLKMSCNKSTYCIKEVAIEWNITRLSD